MTKRDDSVIDKLPREYEIVEPFKSSEEREFYYKMAKLFPDIRDLMGHLLVNYPNIYRSCNSAMTPQWVIRKILKEVTIRDFLMTCWKYKAIFMIEKGETCPCCGR